MVVTTCTPNREIAGRRDLRIAPPAPPARAWLRWLATALAACLFSGVIVAGGTASDMALVQPCFGVFDV